jgi:ferredoxin
VGQDIGRNKNKCTHCGACTAVCPTGALAVQRPEMSVVFNHKKCSVCGLCVPACPTRAMEISTVENPALR